MDPVKAAPATYRVSTENQRVRVLDVHLAAGAKVPMHSHPGYVAVSLTPCKIRFTSADGKSQDLDFKAGDTSWRDAESHSTENIGKTACHALNVELKTPGK